MSRQNALTKLGSGLIGRTARLCLAGFFASIVWGAAGVEKDPFEKRIEAAQGGQATPQGMMDILEEGRRIGRPVAASAAFTAYMAKHPENSLELLRAAGDIAVLAADYPAAVSRYKAYLRQTQPSEEGGEVAARLYTVTIQFQRNASAAFMFMRGPGRPFNQHGGAKKFDGWYLSQCIREKDSRDYADWLAGMYARKEPGPVKRLYHGHLGWLLSEVRQNLIKHVELDTHLRLAVIAPHLAYDPRAQAEVAFLATLMARSYWKTKDPAALKAGVFAEIQDAALAYVKACNDAKALRTVMAMFMGGWGAWDGAFLGPNRAAVEGLCQEALGLLPANEQRALLEWRLLDLQTVLNLGENQWYVSKLAELLKGEEGSLGVSIRALTMGGDLNAAMNHIMTKESHHLSIGQPFRMLRDTLWPLWRKYKSDDPLNEVVYQKALVAFAMEHGLKSPVAFDGEFVREALSAAWAVGGNEKRELIEMLKSAAWVPYNEGDRQWVFGEIKGRFSKLKGNDKQVAADLDEAYKAVLGGAGKRAPAPTPLCAKLAEGEDKTGAELYAQNKNYRTAKLPWGKAVVEWAVAGAVSRGKWEMLDEQCALAATGDDLSNLTGLVAAITNACGLRNIRQNEGEKKSPVDQVGGKDRYRHGSACAQGDLQCGFV